jgi:hypothetical protein
MNTLKEKPQVTKAPSGKRLNLLRLLDPELYLKVGAFSKNLPFIALLCVLALVYIANSHQVYKNIRNINKIENEIKDLRSEYITIKSDLMFQSKQSEVARKVEPVGLKELRTAPKKIYLEE